MTESPGSGAFGEAVVVSHYRIVQKLRSGGMADVYLAEDEVLPRVVALKLLPPERSGDDILQHRFMREARAASSLSHPNIARIYEAGEHDGRVFIAMEYIEGQSLQERIARGAMSIEEIVPLALQLAGAVEEAHAHDIVHRDLKPSNVMLTSRGELKVLDFGLAKFIDPEAAPSDATAWKSESGLIRGTVPYMSPEQALGRAADARSDIFSIGVVLYELVTGRLPFAGANAAFAAGRYEEAIAGFEDLVARDGYSAPLLFDLGNAYFRAGRLAGVANRQSHTPKTKSISLGRFYCRPAPLSEPGGGRMGNRFKLVAVPKGASRSVCAGKLLA